MARLSHIVPIVIAAALAGAAVPAVAQFGSIFRDEPPRPPADVPMQQDPDRYPPPVYRDEYPPPTFPQRQPYPQRQQYPQPQQYPQQPQQPQRANVPAGQTDPRANPPGTGIQSQPLPPPPGGATAPPTTGLPPGTAQPGAAQPGTVQQPGVQPQPQAGLPPQEVVVEPPPHRIANPTAVFAGLDKITGRITKFDVAINETVQFGALQVTPRVCYSRPPTEAPRTDAFIAVDEVTLQGEVRRIFTGWMFASSPGLHAVEHPIYDIWLADCKGGAPQEVAEAKDDDEAKVPTPPRRASRPRQ